MDRGKKKWNVEMVTDYATGERIFRLHVDLPTDPATFGAIAEGLESQDKDKVLLLIKPLAPPAIHASLDAVMGAVTFRE